MSKNDSMEFFVTLAKEGRLEEELDKLVNDESIPSFPSDKFFTPKQWDALVGTIPMTQEIFDRCLYVCDHLNDGVNFHRIVEQFPELEVKYSPEIREKHKAAHDAFKAEYLAKYGNTGFFGE